MTYHTPPFVNGGERSIIRRDGTGAVGGERRRRTARDRRKKGLERLEQRRLFSAVSFENGILMLEGDSQNPNELNVSIGNEGKTLTATANGKSLTVDTDSVQYIRIIGGEKADLVQVDPSIAIPVYVQTGDGNDTIFTGAGDDFVRAGNGDDWVETGAGNDTVYGGNGRDTILLGAGDDKAWGGNGSDRIYGGPGNDTLFGENGDDRIWGEAGNDRIDTGPGSDRARGGEGNDTLFGEASDDLMGNSGSDSVRRVVLSTHESDKPAPAPAPSATITFTLINADTNEPINGHRSIKDGDVIDLAKLPTRNLNIRANVDQRSTAGSVAFWLNGSRVRVENVAPYALAGDISGNYNAWTPKVGKNQVVARAHAAPDATGSGGEEFAITLNVVDSTPAKPGGSSTGSGNNAGPGNPGGNTGGSPAPVNPPTQPPVQPPPVQPPVQPPPVGPVLGNETPNPSAAAPRAVIHAQATSIPAGHAVHVHAMSSQVHSGTPLSARFQWDFGDTGSKYNQLTGFNAAHVYSRPGTYTLTLTITDNAGKSSTAQQTITVRDAARRVYYVSSSGSDSADGRSESTPIRSWDRVRQLLGDNTEFRFRAGDTFNITSGLTVRASNVVFASYGNGDHPTLRWNGARGTNKMIDIVRGSRNVTARDLAFDSKFTGDTEKSGVPSVFRPAGENFSAINCRILNVAYFINNELKPTGVLAQDNVSPLKTGLRAYLAYIVGTDQVYIGNSVVNSTREHVLRSDGGTRILIAHNDLANIAEGRPGDKTDIMKQTITVHWGRDVYIHDNRASGGRVEIGPLGAADGLRPENIHQRLDRVVLDGNRFDFEAFQRIELDHGTDGVMIRGNRISVKDGPAVNVEAMAIHTSWPQYGQRNVRNVWMTADNVVRGGRWVAIGRGSSNVNVFQPGSDAARTSSIGSPPTAAPAVGGIVLTDGTLRGFTTPNDGSVDLYALKLKAA